MINQQVSLYQFKNIVQDEEVKAIKYLHFLMFGGSVLFACIILFMYYEELHMTGHHARPVALLSVIHIVLFCIVFPLSGIMFKKLLRKYMIRDENKAADLESLVGNFVSKYKVVSIFCISMIEVVVYFGFIICMLAISDRTIYRQPYYCLNGISFIIFTIYILATVPTKERMYSVYLKVIMKAG